MPSRAEDRPEAYTLRRWRVAAGRSQQEVAELLHHERQNVQKIEERSDVALARAYPTATFRRIVLTYALLCGHDEADADVQRLLQLPEQDWSAEWAEEKPRLQKAVDRLRGAGARRRLPRALGLAAALATASVLALALGPTVQRALGPPPFELTLERSTPAPETPVPLPTALPPVTAVPPPSTAAADTLDPQIAAILSASFVDADHGWLLGTPGTADSPLFIRRTVDGGQTWQPLADLDASAWSSSTSFHQVGSLVFANTLDGWAFRPGLWVTHDGGASWTDESRADVRIGELRAVGGTAWRMDVNGPCSTPQTTCRVDLKRTQDGGRSWLLAPNQPLSSASLLSAHSPNEVWLVGPIEGTRPSLPPDARILVTRDGGASWQERPFPCSFRALFEQAMSVSLDGKQLWLACGGQPGAGQQPKELFVSSDDGRSWTDPGPLFWSGYVGPLVALFADRAFWGEHRGGGSLLGTRDGGRTWQEEFHEPDDRDSLVAPIPFVDARHGWAVSISAVWRTIDGGESWHRIGL